MPKKSPKKKWEKMFEAVSNMKEPVPMVDVKKLKTARAIFGKMDADQLARFVAAADTLTAWTTKLMQSMAEKRLKKDLPKGALVWADRLSMDEAVFNCLMEILELNVKHLADQVTADEFREGPM